MDMSLNKTVFAKMKSEVAKNAGKQDAALIFPPSWSGFLSFVTPDVARRNSLRMGVAVEIRL
jgi:hypothetical protein